MYSTTISKEFNNSTIIYLLNNCWNSYSKVRPTMIEIIEELKSISFTLSSSNQKDFSSNNLSSEINTISQYISKSNSLSNNNKKVSEMNVEEICEWLLTLELKKDYSSIIRKENIKGDILVDLEEEEWKELFPIIGDRKTVKKSIK